MRLSATLEKIAQEAKWAASQVSQANTAQKNGLLLEIADALESERDTILKANSRDREIARAKGMQSHLLDRLSLEGRFEGVVDDVRHVATLPDPVGEVLEERTLPNGLELRKERVPIGVLGVIYESRPNVTVDIASLALKTGNCALLRGGSETLSTNKALVNAIRKGIASAGLPQEAIGFIQNPNRSQIKQMVKLDGYIDMIIPRGGAALHDFCRRESTIPVITGGVGICHMFVEKSADLTRSIPVIVNAKTDRPSVCNALDTLLIEAPIASTFLPQVVRILQDKGVSLRFDTKAANILGIKPLQIAEEEDWKTEWLSLTLGIKIVESLDEALEHIRKYSSGHSDAILTENPECAATFVRAVDSAAVYVNASTRFTDGGQFGLGAEVAVSTQKLHARGPMGLRELTTYKWIAKGNYHVRER